MERWQKQATQRIATRKELVRLQKRKKDENFTNLELVNHVISNFKYVVVAIIFDLLHYNIYPFFEEAYQVHIYDSSQSMAFLLYIYALYKVIPKEIIIAHFVLSTWLWYSIGDVINVVYELNHPGLKLENILLLLNFLIFTYKFRSQMSLRIDIFICEIKLVLHERIF